MLVEKKVTQKKAIKRNRFYPCTVYVYECDECHVLFETKRSKQNDTMDMHFCTTKCYQHSMREGVARQYVISSMTNEVIEKKKKTHLEHYGVETSFSLPQIQQKCKETSMRLHGSPSSMGDPNVRAKKEQTFIDRYGVRVPISQCSLIISKSFDTQIERYGSLYRNSQEYKDRVDFSENARKAHETMKRNGTYAKSKPEDECYNILCEYFGVDNVERQVRVNGWQIDFYVKTIETYVQFDGLYWHGLNRPIEKIMEFNNPRDIDIYGVFLRDQQQVTWFKENNIKLVRIRDEHGWQEVVKLSIPMISGSNLESHVSSNEETSITVEKEHE